VSSSILSIPQGNISVVTDPGRVWRVGYRPDPWTWTPWQYAENGRFAGRWDDPDGNYRTLYTGTTLLGCLLEVLACFRPDPTLIDELDGIIEDPDDLLVHPTPAPGTVPATWLIPRVATTGTLIGTFCAVTNTVTLSTLRPLFLGQALRYGLPDFDAAALRLAKPRALTQAVSSLLYAMKHPRPSSLRRRPVPLPLRGRNHPDRDLRTRHRSQPPHRNPHHQSRRAPARSPGPR